MKGTKGKVRNSRVPSSNESESNPVFKFWIRRLIFFGPCCAPRFWNSVDNSKKMNSVYLLVLAALALGIAAQAITTDNSCLVDLGSGNQLLDPVGLFSA